VVHKKARAGFSLPFGFVQSPLLASVALDCSALGAAFRAAGAVKCSVYVDDILLSADTEALLQAFQENLADAAKLANFELHKAQSGPTVEAFNLKITRGYMEVTAARMEEFSLVERTLTGQREEAIVQYVEGINLHQGTGLRALYGI
jgi:hypothetical protein